MAFTRNVGTVWGEIADNLYILMTTVTAPMTRGTALGMFLAEDLSRVDSDELRTLKKIPQATLLPPDPILKLYMKHCIRGIERNEAGEK